MGAAKDRSTQRGAAVALRELEAAAGRLSIPVHYAKGDLRGGLCRLGDRWQVIINAELPVEDKAEILAESLAQMDLGAVYIAPRVRALIEQQAHRHT